MPAAVRPVCAVVINLPARPERLAGFLERWHTALDRAGIGIPLRVQAAVPGGDAGCLASHHAALSTPTPAADGPLLVLEDDACFAEDFTLDLPVPTGHGTDWGLLWLGGQHRLVPQPHDAHWTRPANLMRTHAYIARQPAAVAAALARLPRLDPYLARLALPQFVLRRHTVGQTAGRSDIDGTVRTRDEYWHLRYRSPAVPVLIR
jgi:hypothetical protein